MVLEQPERSPDPAWTEFKNRYPDSPHLLEDPLYAMSEEVIDAVQAGVPRFLTADEEAFERYLARKTGSGFFLQRPIGLPTSPIHRPGLTIEGFLQLLPLPPRSPDDLSRAAPVLKSEWFQDGHEERILVSIRDFLTAVWEQTGRDRQEISEATQQEAEERRLLVRRGEAYAGWLVLHKPFRRQLRYFRAHWECNVASRGGFPRRPRSAPTPDGESQEIEPDECVRSLSTFYRRWCLDRMLTWDLPDPQDALLYTYDSVELKTSRDDGLTLFVPWHLLRGDQLDLQEVARRIRFESTPDHLRGWVCKEGGKAENGLNEITYQRLLWLYRCYELVLFRRYKARCVNNIERLDRSLGELMGVDGDWVKRLRLRMARELTTPGQDSVAGD